MAEILTAQQLMAKYAMDIPPFSTTRDLMIKFAQEHVQAALKAASESAYLSGYGAHIPSKRDSQDSVYVVDDNGPDFIYSVDKDSILNAYPLTNIK